MAAHAVDIMLQIVLKTGRVLGCLQIFPAMQVVGVIEPTEAAGVCAQRNMNDDIDIDGRKKSIIL